MLKSRIESKAEQAEELPSFSGTKLSFIRDQVANILTLIGRNGIFDQYTRHDISHIDQLLKIAEWVIPSETAEAISPAEWLMLVLAIYFHDMGMLVTKKEFDARTQNRAFKRYTQELVEKGTEFKEADEVFLYQEYVRATHAQRINRWISGSPDFLDEDTGGSAAAEIRKLLEHLPPVFKRDLGKICESHHLDDLDDFEKYPTCVHYGNDDKEQVNLHYIAIILRTVDLLHITSDRTPSIQFSLISPTNQKSIQEWQKQRAVNAVMPKEPRDQSGNIDRSLPKDTIEITAYFDQPDQAEAFFGLSAYIQYMRAEIHRCYDWIQQSIRKEGTEAYQYPWQKVDDRKIETRGFEPNQLSFTVDQDSILQMLVGHTLYNNSSVVIRELVQNGLDAIKLQYCIETGTSNVPSYIENGTVHVSWSAEGRCLTVSDNGTGMTISEVKNYLLTVGVSKYRSDAFKKKYPSFPAISRFGIGILTCFLIADDVDITTSSLEEETANIISLRKVNGNYLLKKVSKNTLPELIRNHGTAITLHVRRDVDINGILADTKKWVVFPPCRVFLDHDGNRVPVGYKSPKEALTQYLNDHRCAVDNKKYRVEEMEKDGIILAYALEYNTYLHEWSLLNAHFLSRDEDEDISPVGTCVEGIRVEFSSPGYKDSSLLAVVNTRNCPMVLTNVARSAIEDNQSTDCYLTTLYGLYAKHIQSQVRNLQDMGYSLSWAVSESKFLIDPLMRGSKYTHSRDRPHNSHILLDQLAQIECIILESERGRQTRSAKDILELDQVLIVDSEMVTSAESLLRQVQSETTLQSILETVQKDIDIPFQIPLFCNYDNDHILHRYALRNKEASSITVNKAQRRIDIVFSTDASNWKAIETLDVDVPRRPVEKVYIPTSDIQIAGIDNELGVQAVNGLYLSSQNEFVQYICGLIQQFDYTGSREDMLLAQLLMSIISNDLILSVTAEDKLSSDMNRWLENALSHRSASDQYTELLDKIWHKVDKNEFLSRIFAEKYEIYRRQDWSRSIKSQQ